MKQSALILLALSLTGGCSTERDDSLRTADASTRADASPGTPQADDATALSRPSPPECGSDRVRLELDADASLPAMDVAVVWFQVDDDGIDPPAEIGYRAPIADGATSVEIPFSEIALPTEPLLLCEREIGCTDEYECGCEDGQDDPRIALGVVVALRADDHAPIEYLGFPEERFLGAARVVIGHSVKAHGLGGFPLSIPYLPERVYPGFCGYEAIGEGDDFDVLGPPAETYPMTFCNDTEPCDLELPNLS